MNVLEIIKQELRIHAGTSRFVTFDDVTADTTLDELGVDSLRAIAILYAIEDETGVEIPNEALETIKTVGDIIDIVECGILS